jgi:superfamily II DNA/RNA helicase
MNIMRPFNDQTRFLDHLLTKPSEDLIGIAHPGTGKTTTYCISILQRLDLSTELAQNTPQAVVLVPTARLARHVGNLLRTIGRLLPGLTVLTVTGGYYRLTGDQVGCSVIVGLPESVSPRSELFRGDEIRMFIIDDIVKGRFKHCEAIKRCVFSAHLQTYYTKLPCMLGPSLTQQSQLPRHTQVAFFFATPLEAEYISTLAPNAKLIRSQSGRSLLATKHLCIKISKDDNKVEKLLSFFSVLSLGSVIIFVKVRHYKLN